MLLSDVEGDVGGITVEVRAMSGSRRTSWGPRRGVRGVRGVLTLLVVVGLVLASCGNSGDDDDDGAADQGGEDEQGGSTGGAEPITDVPG